MEYVKASNNPVPCTCGRSPTKECCGWHELTESAYQYKRQARAIKLAQKYGLVQGYSGQDTNG